MLTKTPCGSPGSSPSPLVASDPHPRTHIPFPASPIPLQANDSVTDVPLAPLSDTPQTTDSEPAAFRPVGVRLSESERGWSRDSLGLAAAEGSLCSPVPCCKDRGERSAPLRRSLGGTGGPAHSSGSSCGGSVTNLCSSESGHSSSGSPARLHRVGSSSSNLDEEPQRPIERHVSFGGVEVHPIPSRDQTHPPNAMDIGGQRWSYPRLVAAMRSGTKAGGAPLPIQDHRRVVRTYHNSFKGDELVQWLLECTQLESRQAAVDAAQGLLSSHFIEPCDHNTARAFAGGELYRLWEDSRRVHGGKQQCHVLNGHIAWVGDARHPLDVADELLLSLMEIYTAKRQQALAEIPCCPAFHAFLARAPELQAVDLSLLRDDQERTAFFLNLYHTLALHARALHCVEDKAQRELFFNKLCYNVGGELFTLSDIEYGVLRGNSAPGLLAARRFAKGDSRCRWSLRCPSPETCLAVSRLSADSIPVQAYTKDGLDVQLAGACDDALRRAVRVKSDGIHLPSTCRRICTQLGEQEFLSFLNKHVTPDQRAAIARCRVPRLLYAERDCRPQRPQVCAV
eukprot:TRINITY_DN16066_c0_g1_i1.p1 TRINITY_DN16066_c0_g1~~TRINITY_DN16066_c0_g1_i1.p1  ORF type:complete len:567 (+),score=171.07 TRINITY_DN16066_c0_g1_i1:196-1896(+)